MQKFKANIFIKAPKEKVWDTMLNKDTYQEWTKVFDPSSRYEGSWVEGSEIRFLGTNQAGEEMGMVSRIAKSIPYEYISIEHLGIIKNGEMDTESDEAKSWTPTFENYTLIEKNGGTELMIEQDLEEQYLKMFEEMWEKALLKLKELAETQ